MSADHFSRVKPALTIYAGSRAPHEATAPPEVKMYYGMTDLADATQDQPAQVAPASRGSSRQRQVDEDNDVALPPRSGVRVFAVHVDARTDSGAVFAREAIVRIQDNGDKYRFHSWQRSERELFATIEAGE